jgi:ATP-dependent RNA helicase RhlE
MVPAREEKHEQSFFGLGIAPDLLDVIARLKFTVPTPIQSRAIPIAIAGQDLIGIAQTGTGKTLAFGIPMLQRLAQVRGKGLIVLPTRELAVQVDEVLQTLGRSLGVRTAVLIGGSSQQRQIEALRRNPRIIIATPGRLLDHLQSKTVSLADVSILVLDEADRMLDMGFAPQIKRVLTALPRDRQTMLFSATMPNEIVHIISAHMKLPVRVEIARPGTAAEHIEHELFMVKKEEKPRLLEKVLYDYHGTVLVFSRTKHGAKRICRDVRDMGHTAAEMHANRTLNQRRDALEGFKSGKYRVLVATDIAARGIDVRGIELVVNYDLPENPDDYVHRIGRTGRAGSAGRAISFATPEQRNDVRDIERLVKFELPRRPLPELPPDRVHHTVPERSYPPRRAPFRGRPSRPTSSSRPGHSPASHGASSWSPHPPRRFPGRRFPGRSGSGSRPVR